MSRMLSLLAIGLLVTTHAYAQCACCAGAATGSASGEYNNGLLTLGKKQLVAESYADYRTIRIREAPVEEGDAEMAEEETPLRSLLIGSVGLRYGVSDRFTVSALLPYAFLHTEAGNDRGLGDLIVLGTATVYRHNTFNLGVQAGAELPTGIQKGANFDNTTVVVGSGSVDPMAGLLFSTRWRKLVVQGNGLYKHTTQGFDKTNFGSLSVQSLSVGYRLAGEDAVCSADDAGHPGHTDMGWTLSAGYYGEWLDHIRRAGVADENTGYYLGFATAGTTLSYKTWNLPLTLSLPIVQQMNGTQNNASYRLRAGIVKSF